MIQEFSATGDMEWCIYKRYLPGRKAFRACGGEPERMFRALIPISSSKYKDLQLLMKFSNNEAFYDALPHEDKDNEPLQIEINHNC
ncbi:hypothetical protein PoB_002974800 [Plakobranchus ocellatus]|uniref:Uncharacterized protein n=1 Tax=Plakobranchus ocellatus TaxID=259542 RepID=A0AAV4A902_9GAST|nr:hypothetical protein PoB_002974800 [Plakobranchus ocellatus]